MTRAFHELGMSRKGYCVTINNYTEEHENLFKGDQFEYAVFGREIAPTTKTPHLQGYVHYKKKVRASKVQSDFPGGHITPANGSPKANKAYCTKEGDFQEFGTPPKTGSQAGGESNGKKWLEAKTQAINGNIEDIDPQIYVCHYNTLKRIKSDHATKVPSIEILENEWHYGPTGTGKSRTVRELYPNAFIKDANKWWDGYNGEDVVIIEDIDIYDKAMGRHFKLWGDHYPFLADSKNQGKLDIRPKKMIITSNYHPAEIWEDSKTYDPILRRYEMIKYQLEQEIGLF